jgi:hypothetical protein
MKNRKKLKLKYVIWGQRIWNPSRDKQKSWSKWRLQRDLGSITKNHWYVREIQSWMVCLMANC